MKIYTDAVNVQAVIKQDSAVSNCVNNECGCSE